MSVGLPGCGIGGIFYLLSALWMPFDGALRFARRDRPTRMRLIARQTMLALGIVVALFATGWLIEQLILYNAWAAAFASGAATGGRAAVPRMLRAATFAWTFGTLSAVLLSVQVLRLFFGRSADAAALTTPQPAQAAEQRVA